ncbi:MAG: AAA family ATPase [Firmicutes bacterium]|nr:AAA family ATPase [Bacillota bacterium]
MKKLVLITGAPGVGKTTTCCTLTKMIQGCAWLDSDWCWMINPWVPKTSVQKQYVEGTFSRILRGYLENDDINTVLFSWVINSATMFDLITEPLKDLDFELYKIALVCSTDAHVKRLKSDNRREEQVAAPDSMTSYYHLGAKVIDVSSMSVADSALAVLKIIDNTVLINALCDKGE